MANWISSKLKVAETFLQQIDQQAAESLGKNENPQSPEDVLQYKTKSKPRESSSSSSSIGVPLKKQLQKRTEDDPQTTTTNLRNATSPGIKTPPLISSSNTPSPPVSITDTDWTELLSASTPPKQLSPPPPVARRTANGISSMRRDSRKPLEVKKNHPTLPKFQSKIRVNGGAPTTKPSDVEEEESSSGNSDVIQNSIKQEEDTQSPSLETANVSAKVNGIAEVKKQVADSLDGNERVEMDAPSRSSSVAQDVSGRPSLSSDGTSSESGSTSSSDSEKENERKAERARRKERIMAEKAAAKAIEAIKERENIVARLEGEKQSLEKILEERAKQQAQEASELQTSMMETMDAVDLEKQKHNNTRMEALTRLSKLESANAVLARSLATTQWNLEIEVNKVAELRQQIESKEAVQEEPRITTVSCLCQSPELKKRISKIHQSGSSSNQLEASKGVEFEREILEAEYSFTCDKIGQLQEKAKKLEENIEMARREIEDPTEVEDELKRRLAQMTDHLIQKQAQVESLSSEKATMLFRIETISRMIEENKSIQQLSDMASPSSREDLELGLSDSKWKPSLADRVRSGGEHFGSLVRQLDSIFSAGATFLRRNSAAKFWSMGYLVCLHVWVVYIFMSHSTVSDTRSGAIISLESINKTIGTL